MKRCGQIDVTSLKTANYITCAGLLIEIIFESWNITKMIKKQNKSSQLQKKRRKNIAVLKQPFTELCTNKIKHLSLQRLTVLTKSMDNVVRVI